MAKILLAAVPLLLALSFSSKQLLLQILTTIGSCIAYVGILIASDIFEPREWQLTRAVLDLACVKKNLNWPRSILDALFDHSTPRRYPQVCEALSLMRLP